MKTKQEIRDWLLENAVNDLGALDLSDLDFSNFDGDVYINKMKVKKSLYQAFQDVGESLWQCYQNAGENLYQDCQTVGKDFINHKLNGDERWDEKENCVIRRKKYKKITKQQLAEMGYELTDEK